MNELKLNTCQTLFPTTADED